LSEKNYDVVDSFMVAHYTRKMAVESALYSDPHLFAEFEAAWLLKNSAAVETLRPRHNAAANHHQPPAAADVDVVSKRAASAERRKQKGVERRAEKEWKEEVDRRARAAFKKAISAAAEAALPAPSALVRV
jgi:phage tail protein X